MIKTVLNYFLVLLMAGLALNCGEDTPRPQVTQTPVPVTTAQALVQPLSGQQMYVGSIEPIDRVRLSTKIMGLVEFIYFEEGDPVKKGATLVKMRSQDFDAKLAQAHAAIAEAEVHYNNAQTNLKRMEALYAKKAATQKELDDSQSAFASANARKISAKEMNKEVEEILKYTKLTAPFDGVVTRKLLQAGDLANPGQPILEVENTAQVKVVAKVPESDVQSLHVGMPVKVYVQASNTGTNGKSFSNSIHKIVPAANQGSRQFDIHVVMDNPSGAVKSGMFARIATGTSENEAILIPQKAVFRRGQLEGIFVVSSDNKAKLRWIRTGTKMANQIEVLSGINPGEWVITQSELELLDGQSVEVSQ